MTDIVISNLDVELFFDGHHDLDLIEVVHAKPLFRRRLIHVNHSHFHG